MKDNRVIESVWYRCTFCKILLEDFEKMKIHMSKHVSSDAGQTTLPPLPTVNGTTERDETKDKTTHPRYSLRNRRRQSDTEAQKLISRSPSPDEITRPTIHKRNWRNNTRRKSANSKIKPFPCEFCNNMFARKEELEVHVRIHTGERPYVCKICKKAFTQLTNLNNHLRTHTGERPFVCKWCGKRFAQVTNLMFHERLHTGEKPYECNTCGNKFAQIANYQTHMKTHKNSCTSQCADARKVEVT